MSKEGQSRYRRRHPDRHRAHQAVYRAKKRGDLIPADACEGCGKEGKVEASHDDYDRPLDVEWLCRECHLHKDGMRFCSRHGDEFWNTDSKEPRCRVCHNARNKAHRDRKNADV